MDKRKVSIIAIILFLCLGSFVFANSTQSNFEESANSDVLVNDNGGRSDSSDYGNNSNSSYDTMISDGSNISTNNGSDSGNNMSSATQSTYRGSSNSGGVNGDTSNTNNGIGNGSSSGTGEGTGNGTGGNGSGSGTGGNTGNGSGSGTGGGDNTNTEDYSELIALIDKLQDKVSNSTKKSDINSAIKYRDSNNILQKIASILDETVRVEFQDKMDVINKVLDDKTAPVINGILDGSYVNKDVSIDVFDNENNIKKVTVNGIEIVSLDSLQNISQEGKYVVEVVDDAFNKSIVTFTIDKTPPKVVVATSDFGIGLNKSVIVYINADEVIKEVNGWEIDKRKKYIYREFFENCSSGIEIEDLAGNKAVASYSITSIDPNYEANIPHATDVSYVTNSDGSVSVTITISKPIYQPVGWTDISGSRVFTKTYYANISETVWLEDILSNIGSVSVVVNTINSINVTGETSIQRISEVAKGAFNLNGIIAVD